MTLINSVIAIYYYSVQFLNPNLGAFVETALP